MRVAEPGRSTRARIPVVDRDEPGESLRPPKRSTDAQRDRRTLDRCRRGDFRQRLAGFLARSRPRSRCVSMRLAMTVTMASADSGGASGRKTSGCRSDLVPGETERAAERKPAGIPSRNLDELDGIEPEARKANPRWHRAPDWPGIWPRMESRGRSRFHRDRCRLFSARARWEFPHRCGRSAAGRVGRVVASDQDHTAHIVALAELSTARSSCSSFTLSRLVPSADPGVARRAAKLFG